MKTKSQPSSKALSKFKTPIQFGFFLFFLTLSHLTALALLKKERMKIGDFIIQQEQVDSGGGPIVPFDVDTQLYGPILSGKGGAILTTGSILKVFDLTAGNFDSVFILNSDEELTRFNQAGLTLLNGLKDTQLSTQDQRYQFLAFFVLHRLLTEQELESAHALVGTEKQKVEMIFSFPVSQPNASVAIGKSHLSLTAKMKKATQEIVEVLNDRSQNAQDNYGIRRQLQSTLLEYYERDQAAHSVFWGSDAAWEKMQGLSQKGRVYCMNGTYQGKTLIRSIAAGLRSRHEGVSVIDFSNLPQSLFMREAKVDDQNTRMAVIENIEALPLAQDVTFLFNLPYLSLDVSVPTLQAGTPPKARAYFAVSKSRFIQGAKAGPSETSGFRKVMGEWVASRKVGADPLIVVE